MADDVRTSLDALIRDSGEDYSSISRLLGRNAAYIQQFIKRGTPRRLAEEDRRRLAAYFRVGEELLGAAGAPAALTARAFVAVPRVDIGASAGPGAIADIEDSGPPIGFDASLLRDLGVRPSSALSIIRVAGDLMEPTLCDGDDILVDRSVSVGRSGAIHVLRLDGMLVVKRLIREGREGYVVRSDNPTCADVTVDDPARIDIVGRVLWCGRRLV